jgi:GTP-binding protein
MDQGHRSKDRAKMKEDSTPAPSSPKQRIVAIVGRPNIGKSAIFNRIIGRRLAIVHAQSGVTRDRLVHEANWQDHRFDLIDTGGILGMDRAKSNDEIEAAIRRQAEAAMEDAAVVIMAVDVTAGLTPMDAEVARMLHKRGIRTIVAANKADNASLDPQAAEFEALGFPVFPVSALHDRGFATLMPPVIAALPNVKNPTIENPLKVAIVGRPNVGKSSYVNRLLKSDRVIVSDVAGTTRDSISIPFSVGSGDQARHYVLIDTAGMRRVTKIDNSVERFGRFRSEESIQQANVAVLVLDAVQQPTEHDKKVAALINEHMKGCVLVINKWDLEESDKDAYIKEVHWRLPFMTHCPIVFVSAKTGFNIRKSVEIIDLVAAQIRTDLPTGLLNRTLIEAYDRIRPPMVQGKRLKLFYATQVGVEPIRIRIFVNDPNRVVPAYREYLIRILRERFGLEGAPIVLQFRGRTRTDKHEKAK